MAVTGLGGVFFKSDDPEKTKAWYREHLGLNTVDFGAVFLWKEKDAPENVGYTVWGAFDGETEYFDPSPEPFMINYRVEDLEGMLKAMRAAGVQVAGEIKKEPNGKFAWVLDPEGRKIELWEPVPSKDDPYLG